MKPQSSAYDLASPSNSELSLISPKGAISRMNFGRREQPTSTTNATFKGLITPKGEVGMFSKEKDDKEGAVKNLPP